MDRALATLLIMCALGCASTPPKYAPGDCLLINGDREVIVIQAYSTSEKDEQCMRVMTQGGVNNGNNNVEGILD